MILNIYERTFIIWFAIFKKDCFAFVFTSFLLSLRGIPITRNDVAIYFFNRIRNINRKGELALWACSVNLFLKLRIKNMNYEKLTSKRKRFVDYLKTVNLNKKSNAQIAEELGIDLSTFYLYRRNKELIKIAEQEKAKDMNRNLTPILHTLVDKALEGDVRAIKLFLDRYDDNKENKSPSAGKKLTPDMVIDIIHKILKRKKRRKK
jgi:hypothetical protein